MATRFRILGSGSSGNAALLETESTRVLIDAGFSGRKLRQMLHESGTSMDDVDAIFLTHEHGDHFNQDTLDALDSGETQFITNARVFEKISDVMKNRTQTADNSTRNQNLFREIKIDTIAAYNTTEGREKFHPKGRDNGYVLNFEGFRIYISGDTEDIPEMRALKDIDLAFVCMNLPFTMDASAAASAVSEFAPKFVYPYHYRGKDGGTQDPEAFAKMVGEDTQVRLAPWYG